MAYDVSNTGGIGGTANPGGAVGSQTASGAKHGVGSGAKSSPSGPSSAAVASAMMPGQDQQGPQRRPGVKQPKVPKAPAFSASNPMMMTQPPPMPHPGVAPPYPDARSPQPTLMPNGTPVMPPSAGFIGAGMMPRVPSTFAPGMTGLLGHLR